MRKDAKTTVLRARPQFGLVPHVFLFIPGEWGVVHP
jgi:hypothetical protein